MRLWSYSARTFLRRPGRNGLTLLGIILALAAVVATRQTVQTIQRAYASLFVGLVGDQELEVAAAGQAGFSADIVDSLRTILAVSGPTNTLAVPLHGLDLSQPGALRHLTLSQGQLPCADEEVLLDQATAQALGLSLGDTLHVWAVAGLTPLRLVGIIQPHNSSAMLGGMLLLPLHQAQHLLQLGTLINNLQVVVTEHANSLQVQEAIQARLPIGMNVVQASKQGATAHGTMRSIEQGLAALSCVALVAASFVLINTLLLNLGERRRDLAILRSLGLTSAGLTRMLLREMLVLGLLGTMGGWILGGFLSWGLLLLMQQFLGIRLPALQWSLEPFLVASILGPGIALLVSFLPVRQASQRSLLAELLQGKHPLKPGSFRLTLRVGPLFLIPGVVLAIGLANAWFDPRTAALLFVPVIGLVLVGSVLLLPLLVQPCLSLASQVFTALEPRLAMQQLLRCSGRTHLTAGVLFLSLTACIGFGYAVRGLLGDLGHWYSNTIVADFLVRGTIPDASFALQTALPEQLAQDIEACHPDAVVEKISFLPCVVNDRQALLLPRTFTPGKSLPLALVDGNEKEVGQRLMQGEVVLGASFARQLNVGSRGEVTIETPHGPRPFQVAGVAQEYAGGGAAVYVEWNVARDQIAVPGVHVFLVSSRTRQVAPLGSTLTSYCRHNKLICQANADLRSQIDVDVGRITGALWALLALTFLVAGLGILNTLTMNVHDQARELGLLRALGLQSRQVFALVLWQAGFLAGFSLVPGVLTGIGLGYLINQCSQVWSGPVTAFHVDMAVILVACTLALGMALLAALLPARRAACLPVTQLLG
jgi:putative ABC transport system permease protein